MTCDEIEELLMPYLLDELDEHRDADVYIHLRKCEACRALAKEMESTVNLMQDAFELDFNAPIALSADRKEKVRASISVEEKPSSSNIITWFKDQQISVQTIAAVLVLCAVLSIGIPMAKVGGLAEKDFALKDKEQAPSDAGFLDHFVMGNDISGDELDMAGTDQAVMNDYESAVIDEVAKLEKKEEYAEYDDSQRELIARGRVQHRMRRLVEATEIELSESSQEITDKVTLSYSASGKKDDNFSEAKPGEATPAFAADPASMDVDHDGAIIYALPDLNNEEVDALIEEQTQLTYRSDSAKPGKIGKGAGRPAKSLVDPAEDDDLDNRKVLEDAFAITSDTAAAPLEPGLDSLTAVTPGQNGQGIGGLQDARRVEVVTVTKNKRKPLPSVTTGTATDGKVAKEAMRDMKKSAEVLEPRTWRPSST